MQINDKTVKLAKLDYDLQKRMLVNKEIDRSEKQTKTDEAQRDIDHFIREESNIVSQINQNIQDLRIGMLEEDDY